MREPTKICYQFGPYYLAPARRELRSGDDRIQLPPRVFDTLLALTSNSGRLLDKDELMRLVWPDTIVEENNLSQAIYLLRKALRDGEGGVRYIETVPKRGYRFLAPVREADDEMAPLKADVSPNTNGASPGRSERVESEASASEVAPSSRRSRRTWPYVLTAAALLVVGCLGVAWRRGALGPRTSGPIRSIAVLPLQNLSRDPDQEYFADGMTDELITDLAQIRELRVVSKTSIMQYKGTRKPLPQIARELGVDAVVEGSVIRSGDKVRITAQLIRTSTDRHIWAKAFDGDLRNVLPLQAKVAEAITDEVRLNLSAQERNRLHWARSYDPEAYDLYLRGRFVASRRNEEAFLEAIGFFKQAAAKDPNFALAYAGLSDCYSLLALFGGGYSWVQEANASARKALALDEDLAEAHTSLAAADVLDWKWAEAEAEFRRALDLNPNSAQAHQWYGNLFLGPMGRHTEAIAELQRAVNLDPLSLIINTDLGYAYFFAGQLDSAYQQYEKVLATDPTFLPVHYALVLYYQQRGMYDQQVKELIEDSKLAGRAGVARAMGQLSGNRRKFFETMAKTGGTFEHPTIQFAGGFAASANGYAALGKKKEALAALQKCYEGREANLIYLKVDPALASLRDEPGFQDLERKVGLLSP